MCTGRDLIARVMRARLPYAEMIVSGDLLGGCRGVCVRAVPACEVRRCCVGARRESGLKHGCGVHGEAVPDATGGRRTLVGSPLQRRRHMWALYGRTRGGLVDTVSSGSAGSSMRGRLGWWGVWWLFRGFYAGRRLGHCVTAKVGAGAVQKGY